MKVALFLSITFLFLQAQASLSGNWTGWGSWKFKGQGDGARCSPMQMTWSESKTQIAIEKGFFDCEVVAMHLEKTTWEIKDNKLFDDHNNEVGKYDGVHLEVFMPSPNEKTTIGINVQRQANHIDYREVWFNTKEKVYVIEGRMFTSGSYTK